VRNRRNRVFNSFVVVVNKAGTPEKLTEREELRRARWRELVASCNPLVNVAACVATMPEKQAWLNGDDIEWDETGSRIPKKLTGKEPGQ
jgi:hypothetical protein